jgi:HlyD family secretion protein
VRRALLIALGVLLLGGIIFASLKAGGSKTGEKVYTEAAVRRPITQLVKASGEVNPRVKVNISAHVVARVDKLFVKEGDRIEKGKPFLILETKDFVADRDQWAAQVQTAKTNVKQSDVALADAVIKLHRAERLQKEGIMTIEQFETAQLNERSARLKVEESGEAVSQSQANLLRAQTDLDLCTIIAPVAGRVITLNVKEGEVVVSGTMNNPASVLGVIADLSEVLAEVDVDETEIVHVQVGQAAVLKVDALPDHNYHGKVTEVGNSGYSKTNQPDVTFFKVKLLFSDPDQSLRPGMSVRAEISTATEPTAIAVPIQAVVERAPVNAKTKKAGTSTASSNPSGPSGGSGGTGDEIKVVFAIEKGKAYQRPVTTGISDETHVAITSGIKPGDQVVTGPYRTLRDLRDGAAVQIGKPGDEKAKSTSDKDDKSSNNSP